jgi:hypothetical protein
MIGNPATRSREAVRDAREELLSPVPTESPQPTPPAREVEVVDAAAIPVTGRRARATDTRRCRVRDPKRPAT